MNFYFFSISLIGIRFHSCHFYKVPILWTHVMSGWTPLHYKQVSRYLAILCTQDTWSWFEYLELDCILKGSYYYRVWQYGLWSFQMGDRKLERFLPKNQLTQTKLFNFEFWINGKLSKVPKFDFQTQFSMSKIIRIFLNFFFRWRIPI